MPNVTELTSIFSDAFTYQLVGDPILAGLFGLLILAYIAYRCRLGMDAIIVIFLPMLMLFATYGFLPESIQYIAVIVVGFLIALGMFKLYAG